MTHFCSIHFIARILLHLLLHCENSKPSALNPINSHILKPWFQLLRSNPVMGVGCTLAVLAGIQGMPFLPLDECMKKQNIPLYIFINYVYIGSCPHPLAVHNRGHIKGSKYHRIIHIIQLLMSGGVRNVYTVGGTGVKQKLTRFRIWFWGCKLSLGLRIY